MPNLKCKGRCRFSANNPYALHAHHFTCPHYIDWKYQKLYELPLHKQSLPKIKNRENNIDRKQINLPDFQSCHPYNSINFSDKKNPVYYDPFNEVYVNKFTNKQLPKIFNGDLLSSLKLQPITSNENSSRKFILTDDKHRAGKPNVREPFEMSYILNHQRTPPPYLLK
ncbi:hypothetical protein SNEBB_000163 [Seison nebaliae]|nr:hypothetical protein SNEBB_000163 [Seison nebaliae]